MKMKKTLLHASFLGFGSLWVLAGCASSEVPSEDIVERTTITEEAPQEQGGIITKQFDALDKAKTGVDGAIDQKNAAIDAVIDADKNVNNSNDKKMDTIPEQIDMTLAQTCTGALIMTNQGAISVEFLADKAPTAVANFCTLAQKGFYDGVTFHRVIKDFMIQGGDPEGTGRGGPGYQFADELPASGEYKIGSLAMANAGPNTNGSQFFIVSGPNGEALPPQYTLFGQVTVGLEIVEKIQNVQTAPGDKPLEDVLIEKIDLQMQ